MKIFVEFLLAFFLRIALWFRYRIKIEGLDKLNEKNLNKPGGVLFLPNHPTVFVDATAITIALWPKFRLRPMVIDYMYQLPIVNQLMRFLGALAVPDFSTASNSLKRKMNDKIEKAVIDGLKTKENFLIFPSGRTKQTAYEAIDGASAVHRIVQEVPQANIVLVRVKGLWGSSFSRAVTGKAPPLFKTFFAGVKKALKNLLFFSPRRQVIIEFVPAPADFPYQANRLELNKYLERFYNLPDGLTPQTGPYPGDSLVLVSYSLWKKEFPELWNPKMDDEDIDFSKISDDVQKKVIKKISELTNSPESSIKREMALTTDLGMDSLDVAELIAFLHDQFDVPGVASQDLTTVGKVMALASKQIVGEGVAEEETIDMKAWKAPVEKQKVTMPEGETIPEVFLNNCERMGNRVACADMRSGVLTYPQLKMRAILLSEQIRKLPGNYVGILLPASVAASVTILACQLAGKTPLMVNWTVGPRHLHNVVQLSNVQAVISSWSFVDRLQNVDFNGIDDKLIMLEDIRRDISLFDKISAYALSKRKTKTILKKLGVDKLSKDDPAVLLFTSGTESMPKGVPLTHHNILSNQRDCAEAFEAYSDDILFGILPPFHSFGFTVTSTIGLLSGFKVAFSPDPTDGQRLAQAFQRWGITVIVGAPTFVKGMIKVATPEQLKTMRLCVTGAEKLPKDLEQAMEKFGKKDCLYEGYGITECSPVLTFTRLHKPRKGVGQPLPRVELCVVDVEDHQKKLKQGEHGLILASGPNIFSGYINPGLKSPFINLNNGVNWFVTGDLGYLDEDNNLILSGRLKRFLKVGGEMISLAALEEALLHTALNKGWVTPNEEGPSLAVTGHEEPGEKTKIFLYTRFSINVDTANQSLKEAGFSNLVKFFSVTQLPELPVMGTGKINYRKLEETEK